MNFFGAFHLCVPLDNQQTKKESIRTRQKNINWKNIEMGRDQIKL